MRKLMLFELRKTYWLYTASLLVLFGYILFRSQPHGVHDMALWVISILHGYVIGARIFHDNSRTQAFVFTLPLTKTRLFSYRLMFGIILLTISTSIILVLLASGMRNVLQQDLSSPYFPYVMWYELRVLIPVIFYSFFGFAFGMYTMIDAQLFMYLKNFKNYPNIFKFLIIIYSCLICPLFFMILWGRATTVRNDMFLISIVFSLSIYCICVCLYFYQQLEIDS